MTQFQEEKFEFSGQMYLHYDGQFIARFKYTAQKRGRKAFQKFLIENFTVEEYFSRFESGEAPLRILMSKGFLLPETKKRLRKAGYPLTPQGYHQFVKNQCQPLGASA